MPGLARGALLPTRQNSDGFYVPTKVDQRLAWGHDCAQVSRIPSKILVGGLRMCKPNGDIGHFSWDIRILPVSNRDIGISRAKFGILI